MIIQRRGLLAAILGAAVAPVFIPPTRLMRVTPRILVPSFHFYDPIHEFQLELIEPEGYPLFRGEMGQYNGIRLYSGHPPPPGQAPDPAKLLAYWG